MLGTAIVYADAWNKYCLVERPRKSVERVPSSLRGELPEGKGKAVQAEQNETRDGVETHEYMKNASSFCDIGKHWQCWTRSGNQLARKSGEINDHNV